MEYDDSLILRAMNVSKNFGARCLFLMSHLILSEVEDSWLVGDNIGVKHLYICEEMCKLLRS